MKKQTVYVQQTVRQSEKRYNCDKSKRSRKKSVKKKKNIKRDPKWDIYIKEKK